MRHDIVKTIVLAAVAALTGGLAGSIFTAVVTHQHPTLVTFKSVLKNVVDSNTTAIVHDLKIGNDNVQFIYTRLIDFVVQAVRNAMHSTVHFAKKPCITRSEAGLISVENECQHACGQSQLPQGTNHELARRTYLHGFPTGPAA